MSDEPAASSASSSPAPAVRKRYREDFEWGKVLGEGAYGEVRLATDKETGVTYAIKICNKKHIIAQKKVEWVNREKVLLDKLRHPNIVNLYFTFSDPESLHFVLEYCPYGELFDHIRKHGCFSEACTQFYAAEIVSALEFMHGQGVCHRDLKPENILVGDNGHLKLADFGTAKEIGTDRSARTKSFVGTAEYVAPELLRDKEQGLACDLWSLGCMIYQFATGRMPFRGANEYLTFQLVQNREIVWPENIAESTKDIIDQLLDVNPDNRLGNRIPGGYAELKAHPFFTGIDWDTLPQQTPPPFAPPEVAPKFAGASEKTASGSAGSAENKSESPVMLVESPPVSSSPSSEAPATNGVDEERKKKLEAQKSSSWAQFLAEDELIVEMSTVLKKKGLFARRRQLILTDAPRLFYVDPDKLQVKGEVPWSKDLRVEQKSNRHFLIHTPGRAYKLEDTQGSAERWVDAIGKLHSAGK